MGNIGQKKDNRIVIRHIGLLIYILYMIWVTITEWINFIPKVAGGYVLKAGIAEIIAAIVVVLALYFFRNLVKYEKPTLNAEMIIGFILIFSTGLLFSVFPDKSFDTLNYHLIAQNPEFENYFIEDYAYGNFQVWGFRLCDRMFYYFRMILGYRWGTLLNTVALALSFSQVYAITGRVIKEKNKRIFVKKIVCNRLLWSLAIVFSFDAIMMIGSYCVDAIVMPIAIRVVREIIEHADESVESKNIYLFALLCGLWIAGKLTNIVYVIPCVVIYVILHFKDFKIKDWFISIALGLYSYLVYMIFNFLCTGNPFFPYYNSIFKSPYYPIMNFKDTRWGGQNIFEKIFWLIYATFKPEYRLSEIWDRRNALLMFSLVSVAILLIGIILKYCREKKVNKKLLSLIMLAISSEVLWAFTTGIGRYFMIGRVIWGLVAYIMLVQISETKSETISQSIPSVLSIIVVVSMGLNVVYAWSIGGWSVNDSRRWENVGEQLKYVLSDRKGKPDTDIELFALTDDTMQGVAELINPNAYAFHINYIGNTKIDGNAVLQEKFDEYLYGYDLHRREFYEVEEYIEQLNNNNLYITDISSVDTEIGPYQLVQLEYLKDTHNTVWTSNKEDMELFVKDKVGRHKLSFIGGMAYNWPVSDIEVVVKDGEKIIGSTLIDSQDISAYEIDLDIPEKTDVLTVEACYTESGEQLSKDAIDFVFCINLQIQ